MRKVRGTATAPAAALYGRFGDCGRVEQRASAARRPTPHCIWTTPQHFAESLASSQSCLAADAFFACEMPVNTVRALYGMTPQSTVFFAGSLVTDVRSLIIESNTRKRIFFALLCAHRTTEKIAATKQRNYTFSAHAQKYIMTKYRHLEQNCGTMVIKKLMLFIPIYGYHV